MNPSSVWGLFLTPYWAPNSEKHMMFCPCSPIILRKCPPRALTTLWQFSQSKDRGWVLQQSNIYWKDSLKQLSQWKSWLPLALVDRFAWVEGNLWLYSVGLQQGHLSFAVPFKCKYLEVLWSYGLLPWQKSSWISLLQPLCQSGVRNLGLICYQDFWCWQQGNLQAVVPLLVMFLS